MSDPTNDLTTFFTAMVGLSVAAERVTETAKQWLGPGLVAKLSPQRYAAVVQTMAIVSGGLVTALSGLNPLKIPQFEPFAWGNKADWLSWVVSAVLVSGGSAFWNHLLDILKATKVEKEQAANADAPENAPAPIAP